MARVEVCFFFIFCDITRGNMYRSCVTTSVLLLPESVNVAQIIVMVRRLYLIAYGCFFSHGRNERSKFPDA